MSNSLGYFSSISFCIYFSCLYLSWLFILDTLDYLSSLNLCIYVFDELLVSTKYFSFLLTRFYVVSEISVFFMLSNILLFIFISTSFEHFVFCIYWMSNIFEHLCCLTFLNILDYKVESCIIVC